MAEERIEVSETELDLVKDIFKNLTKTIKTFNVYPKDNPIYQKFVRELNEKFTLFFESSDELTVDIRQYSLVYKENELLSNQEKTDNIALLLFADGIRQLNFQKGLSDEEVTDFIEILRAALKSKADDEDDIVTLLWERNIRNMGYTAVEDSIDDNLAVEEGLLRTDQGEEVGEQIRRAEASVQWGPEARDHETVSTKVELEPLTDDEAGSLREEISAIGESMLLSSAFELLLELLKNDPETESFPEIVMSLGKILDLELQKKNVPGAIMILKELNALTSSLQDTDRIAMTSAVTSTAGQQEHLKRVVAFSTLEEIRQYFNLLGKNSIREIIAVLGEVQDRKHRKIICEILAELGKQDIPAVAEGLDDERWFLVRNIVMVLGFTREPAAVKYLGKVAKHSDVRVRRETARALDGMRVDEAKRISLSMLRDPDLTVRVSSLRSLRRFKDPAIFGYLKESATREELKKKAFVEKKELLETMAVIGGQLSVPILSDLLKKRWLIEKEDATEIRAAAAYGLGVIGGPDVIAMLEKEAVSKKALLREACLKSLKELQNSGKSGN